jgi:hypothetical protein
LLGLRFVELLSDHCLFRRGSTVVAVYVDDLLICTTNTSDRDQILQQLEEIYGKLKIQVGKHLLYRGLQIDMDADKIKIHQTDFVKKLINETNTMKISNVPASRRMMEDDDNPKLLEKNKAETYRTIVSKLLWVATQTRGDMRFTVSVLSRYVAAPTGHHWNCLLKALQYLKGTESLGLEFTRRIHNTELTGYSDAAYLLDSECRGQTGMVLMIGTCTVQCESTRQPFVTMSSSESELMAMNSTANAVIWMKRLLSELGYPQGNTIIRADNMSAITMAEVHKVTKRTKHIEAKWFRVADMIAAKEVQLLHQRGDELVADILTKPVAPASFLKMRDILLGITADGSGSVVRAQPQSRM